MKRPSLLLWTAAAFVAPFAVLACASIMHGTSQEISVASQPTGATVIVDNQSLGVTPLAARLKRKDKHTIQIRMSGYEPFELTTTRGTSGWVAGNLIFGGLIGLAVDFSSGGAYKINPAQVSAELARIQANATFQDGVLYVVLVSTPDPSWEKIGQLERVRL